MLITAYSDSQTVSEAINRGGVSHYVTKPWKLPEVLTVLREASSAARVQRMTRELQSAMLAKERMGALAAARGQALHDLANAASPASTSCQALQGLAADGRPHLPQAIADGFDAELHYLRRAATYLEALHTRVRGLNRAGEPEAVSNDLDELFATAVSVARGHLPHAARVEIECPPRTTAWCDPTDLGRIS